MEESMISAPELFDSVAVCGALVFPIIVAPKVKEPGENIGVPVTALPVSVVCCGLLAALSLNAIASFFEPLDTGLKTTETVHDAPDASEEVEDGQLFAVIAKSGPIVIELIVTGELCEFVSVSVFVPELLPTATFPQLSAVGETETRDAVPVPLSFALCGLLLASLVTVSVPVIEPALCGEKVTEILQVAPPARELPQVFVSAKFGFEAAIPEIAIAVVPLFVSVNVTGVPLLPV
jgi:hypothetical protein